MSITHGKILIVLGISHVLLGVSPLAFGHQFAHFSDTYFFKISEGLKEFPLFDGKMNYENFAAFWFVYFGLALIPLGILVNFSEKEVGKIPLSFIWTYILFILIGIYMIPFSGMTFLMLPQALFMLYQTRKLNRKKARA